MGFAVLVNLNRLMSTVVFGLTSEDDGVMRMILGGLYHVLILSMFEL
jgi:hypothetical protein